MYKVDFMRDVVACVERVYGEGVTALIHDVTCVPGAQQGALFLTAELMHTPAAPDN